MSKILRTNPNPILSAAVEYHGFIFTQGVVARNLDRSPVTWSNLLNCDGFQTTGFPALPSRNGAVAAGAY